MDKNEIAFLDTMVYRSLHTKSTPGSITNQQIRNNIYTTIQPIPGIKKNLSPMGFSSDAEEYAQKATVLKKKLKKYITN